MDRHGTCMINLQTSEVFHLQSFEDQAFYWNSSAEQKGGKNEKAPINNNNKTLTNVANNSANKQKSDTQKVVNEQQQVRCTATKNEFKTYEKQRSQNIDMWQKYNDCILCDQKSIPNT